MKKQGCDFHFPSEVAVALPPPQGDQSNPDWNELTVSYRVHGVDGVNATTERVHLVHERTQKNEKNGEIRRMLVSGALDDNETIGNAGADLFAKSGNEQKKKNKEETVKGWALEL